VTAVSTQSRTFVGLTADHKTIAYGIWGEAGAPVGVTDVVSVSAGSDSAFLRADGSAYLWPSSSAALPPPPYSALVGGLGSVVAIVPPQPEPTTTAGPTSEPTPTSGPTATRGPPEPTAEPTRPHCTVRPHRPTRPHHPHRRHRPPTSRPAPSSSVTAGPTAAS